MSDLEFRNIGYNVRKVKHADSNRRENMIINKIVFTLLLIILIMLGVFFTQAPLQRHVKMIQLEQFLTGEKAIIEPADVHKFANNEIPADELIKTTYTKEELLSLNYNRNISFHEIMTNMKVECIRTNGDYTYLIFKCQEGGYCICMFMDSGLHVVTWYRFDDRISYEEFISKVKLNETTLKDLPQIDPYCNWKYFYGFNPQVYENFDNGICVAIYFENRGTDYFSLVVNEISEKEGDQNLLYSNLLPIDKELFLKTIKNILFRDIIPKYIHICKTVRL